MAAAAAEAVAAGKTAPASSSSSTHLSLREEDVVKMACEFMNNRQLHISQVTLERETGVINGCYSDDLLFLRQLILDGQWEDTIEFIQPLASLPSFDAKRFTFAVLRAKFVELLCIKSEAPIAAAAAAAPTDDAAAVDTVVEVLKEIESVAPSKEHYSNLCLLLTMNKLSDHPDYRSWNPSKGRAQCFKEVLPLVQDLLGGAAERKQALAEGCPPSSSSAPPSVESASSSVACNDRLLQLLIKGILYESCVDYCQAKATGAKTDTSIEFTRLLTKSELGDSDLSLLSWLQSIPADTFACPFEQRSLNVDVERISAPQLETSWTEHMMIKPIKPNIFPHSAMPNTRPRGTDIMTKSLSVSLAGGNRSLSTSVTAASSFSVAQGSSAVNATARLTDNGNNIGDMSKSFASFHLSNKVKGNMEASVDQLFREEHSGGGGGVGGRDANKHVTAEYTTRQQKIEGGGGGGTGPSGGDQQPLLPQQHRHQQPQQRNHDLGHAAPPSTRSKRAAAAQPGPPRFLPLCSLEDVQAIRCAEFNPNGSIFAVGSNSKVLRICQYQGQHGVSDENRPSQTHVLMKRARHHKGSIYCLAWNPLGNLIATGSNDKTVKIMRFNAEDSINDVNGVSGGGEHVETELAMHDGTVRDLVFMGDSQTLVSGGAGDCKIYVTDCPSGQPVASLPGHGGHVLGLSTWASAGAVLASGSQDKTARFWDLRTRGCVNVIPCNSPVAACTVDPSGRLLVTGHEDSTCVLYDIRGGRVVQTFKPHTQDVRSVRFSPNAYYLLSGSYDNRLVLTDLQGDLSQPLPTVCVATHDDKVISGRWHPTDFSFVSTSADKSCTLWGLPPA